VVTLLGEDEAVAPLLDDDAVAPLLLLAPVSDDEAVPPSSNDDESEPPVATALGVEDWVVVDTCAASAGSWPDTRMSPITSQAAMNSATAPATTRRRSIRVRPARAWRSACAFAEFMPGSVIAPRRNAVRNR
jgi:hypothetical protein